MILLFSVLLLGSFWALLPVFSCRVVDASTRLRVLLYRFFLFKQKTAYEMRISDWSSDVCSSDLQAAERRGDVVARFDQRRRVESRRNVDHAILDRAVARDEYDERLVRGQGHEGELLQNPLMLGHEHEARACRQPRQRGGRPRPRERKSGG